jgi:hypothetical protein
MIAACLQIGMMRMTGAGLPHPVNLLKAVKRGVKRGMNIIKQ